MFLFFSWNNLWREIHK